MDFGGGGGGGAGAKQVVQFRKVVQVQQIHTGSGSGGAGKAHIQSLMVQLQFTMQAAEAVLMEDGSTGGSGSGKRGGGAGSTGRGEDGTANRGGRWRRWCKEMN